VPDAQRREVLLLALAQRFDDTHRRLIGEIGEDLVVDAPAPSCNSSATPTLRAAYAASA
jgi:hypothetical protein